MIKNLSVFINVTFPDNSVKSVPVATSLIELSKDYEESYRTPIVAARVNNDIKELSYQLREDCFVEFIDITYMDGMRIYKRSLSFLLIKAVYDLFPDRKVIMGHTLNKGLYCEVQGQTDLTEQDVARIEKRMKELVADEIPFIKYMTSMENAKEYFAEVGRMDRYHAIEHRIKDYVTLYSCGGYVDYFYGYMVPHTGYLKTFSLQYCAPGLVLLFPKLSMPEQLIEFRPQEKLVSIFNEYKQWLHILGINNVGSVNDVVEEGGINELIRVSEALHEKKIALIADKIAFNKNKKKVVLIAGPSSSGKTTFAKRLAIQLKVNGLMPVTISLDDYFVGRTMTPLDEYGEYDFEALEALDLELFNQQLSDLINYKEVEVPIFNFTTGERETEGRKLKLREGDIVIIEGIHALNDKLTESISKSDKFLIYASALTSMNLDIHNRIPSTDIRMIRRIVRDNQFRGSNAISTLKRWPSVHRGEEKNIFPFSESADAMFNSSLAYELGVLKTYAEPLLKDIDQSNPEYSEAKRLLGFLEYFLPIETDEIPSNSIIREFIGNSCFY